MPTRSPITAISGKTVDTRRRFVIGGAAGNLTVPGLLAQDELLHVIGFKTDFSAVVALGPNGTNEFKITADGTINNTGGTNTTGYMLEVEWATRSTRLG